ncbi:proton-coupled folate transporter-like [Adelges cooleyi]|uniref:proton-coupled folate transporter-like n=1 Tax=Adelges cooleyi TaxID=133065 RepID=UPI00217F35D0|nr:proton-coupled folate transporter-like [Adelges cooleyi]XP_050439359.1 proton-coupled folate transporter-like [Adelges cooleyi]XP_050439368.1 proton-coupled folate transporter-like [Adelges cooleyi]XP_050439377.1 proton-coupled folate transporter-like [Adelges cooleyi]XP_050439385.1 proton-coupled folate transporter-like [Adelges cooleyi]
MVAVRIASSATVKKIQKNISVEPVVFLFCLSVTFSNSLNSSLLLYKSCSPDAMPHSIGSKCPNEASAEHQVTPINAWKSVVMQLVPMFLTLLAGPWSDRHGRQRRSLMLLPIVGQLLADVASLYSSVKWAYITPLMTAVLQVTMSATTGSTPLFNNGIFSYVSDTSDESWRTLKFGLVICATNLAGTFGMLAYGFIVEVMGFVDAFALCVVLDVLAFFLVLNYVKDTPEPYEHKPFSQDLKESLHVADIVKNSFRVLFKPRSGNKKTVLILMILVCGPLTSVPSEGETSLMYMFLRNKFSFTDIDYSVFGSYRMLVVIIGTVITLGVMSHLLKVNDALIGLISCIFDFLSELAFYFAKNSWQLYFIPPLQIFLGAAISITGSISSKCVEMNEMGTMHSVKLIIESVSKAIVLPMYNFLYNKTLETNPSAFYLISVVLVSLSFPFFFITYILTRKNTKKEISPIEYGTF